MLKLGRYQPQKIQSSHLKSYEDAENVNNDVSKNSSINLRVCYG